MTLISRDRLRKIVRRSGFDIVRFPSSHRAYPFVQLLERRGIRTVLDIGANRGQFALGLLEVGFTNDIVSFEPLRESFEFLEEAARSYSGWQVRQYAIGSTDGIVTMNIASNGGASSSILGLGERHKQAAPDVLYTGTEDVRQRTLDTLLKDEVAVAGPLLLKVDVQGYELEVLRGAKATLSRCSVVQLEVSFGTVYDGGAEHSDVEALLSECGFQMIQLTPIFWDLSSGALLQADAVYVRS